MGINTHPPTPVRLRSAGLCLPRFKTEETARSWSNIHSMPWAASRRWQQSSFQGRGRWQWPVIGEIDIRLAHQLPGKPREAQAHHRLFDKPSRWQCSDLKVRMGFPGGPSKESACNAGDYLQWKRWDFDPWVR